MTAQPFVLRLQHAALQQVMGLTPCPVPVTTIAAARVGDITLTITGSVAGFVDGGIVSFWDNSGEDFLYMNSVTGPTITLATPLTMAHAVGATIATNLLDAYPTDTSVMRASGWPVVSAFLWDRETAARGMGAYWTTPDPLSIAYQLTADQPPDAVHLDALMWSRSRQHQVATACETISLYLLTHSKLHDDTGPVISGITRIRESSRHLVEIDSIPHYLGVLQIFIADSLLSIQP